MNKFAKLYMSFICIITLLFPTEVMFAQVNQERWAYEYVPGIQGVQSPFFEENLNLLVSSSWNEPRLTEIHKGVDQAARGGTNVGPMYETARVLVNQYMNGGGNTQTIRYYNFETGKTFFSIYMHLSAYVKTNNTVVYPSDVTAKTGNTGLNCGNGCYHLHYELLDSIPVTTLANAPYFSVNYNGRVGVNPFSHMTPLSAEISNTTWQNLTVFKQPTVTNKKLSLSGVNSSFDGNNALTEVKIYFKANQSPYYSLGNMTKENSGRWTYEFPASTKVVDYFVIGRRSSAERWVSFPVKRYDLGNNTAGLVPSPNQCGCTYDTLRITF
jgi:hypothetical protein